MQLLVLWILLQWSCLHIVLIFGTYSIVYKTRYISQGSVSSNLEQTKFPFFFPLFFVKSTHSLQKNSDIVKISSLVTLLRYTLQLNTTRITITAIADQDMHVLHTNDFCTQQEDDWTTNRDYSMESAHERFLFTSCDASKKKKKNGRVNAANEWVFLCIATSEIKSFKYFPWNNIFILYILRFFSRRHISNVFYFAICLHTNFPTERLCFEKKDKDN